MKTCSSCKLDKPLTTENFDFRTDTKKWRTQCKACIAKKQKERDYKKSKAKKEQKQQYIALIKEKRCAICEIIQCIDNFDYLVRSADGRRDICHICFKKEAKKYPNKYYEEHKEQLQMDARIRSAEYRKNNPDKIKQSKKDNYWKYKVVACEYKERNKEKIAEYRRAYKKNKYHNDPCLKLRHSISTIVKSALKDNKNGSILDYLPSSIAELKTHLESLFASWMTWQNHGKYDAKTWNDNDSTTWTWQLDHIIPQSDLPYDSMEHPNFKKCWALDNLRPYSAKQNCIDGAGRVRHKK